MNEFDYFIHLVSCHLNGKKPVGFENINWQKIYNLCERHDVLPLVAYEINLLNKNFQPDGEIAEKFEAKLNAAFKNYDLKASAVSSFINVLTSAGVAHLLIKGAVLQSLYPVPALRASRDTDVILKESDYSRAFELLCENGFETESSAQNDSCLVFDNQRFEIYTELENINVQSKIYFSTPFDDISQSSGFTYKLMPVYHLIYIITHIAHHLKEGGVGLKMLTDADVIIRNYPDFEYIKFWQICNNIKIEKTAKVIFALCKKWFDTPVQVDFSFENNDNSVIYDELAAVILNSGADEENFGFINKDENDKPKGKVKKLFEKMFSKNKKQQFVCNSIKDLQADLLKRMEIGD